MSQRHVVFGSKLGLETAVAVVARMTPVAAIPVLERSLRVTEFTEDQDDRGHQVFRTGLPILATWRWKAESRFATIVSRT